MTALTPYPVIRPGPDGALLLECAACQTNERLELPISLTVATYRGSLFARAHRSCHRSPHRIAPAVARSEARWERIHDTFNAPPPGPGRRTP